MLNLQSLDHISHCRMALILLPETFHQSDEQAAVPVLVNENLQPARHPLELQRGHLLLPQQLLHPVGLCDRPGQLAEVNLHPLLSLQLLQADRPVQRLLLALVRQAARLPVLLLIVRIHVPLCVELPLVVHPNSVAQVHLRLSVQQHNILVGANSGHKIFYRFSSQCFRRILNAFLPAKL